MNYRKFGKTDLKLSEIGYGAWGIGGAMWRGATDKESLKALNLAIDQGLNFIDTALAYGQGHSEQIVGQVVRQRTEEIFVATKVPPRNQIWPARGPLEESFPYEYIIDCAEQSLRNLKMDYIDLLQLHVWNPDWLNEEGWFEALAKLREQGKVRFFGVSVNDHQPESVIELVKSEKISSIQVIFNIFDQSPAEELLPLCLKEGVGVIVRVPFDEGSLTGNITPETTFAKKDWRNHYFKDDRKEQVWERIKKLEPLLGDEVETLPELALRYCLGPEAVTTVIPGMRSSRHVDSNCRVSGKPALSAELLERIKKHRWVRNFYPVV